MQQKIKDAIKEAMKAKEMDKLNVLRLISAAFTGEVVAQGRPPTDPLSDEDAMKILKRLVNQRNDSIAQFEAGGRPELADSERAELAIIETFLPPKMSEEEIRSKVSAYIASNQIDPSKKGQAMGAIMKELGASADGTTVKRIVDELLA